MLCAEWLLVSRVREFAPLAVRTKRDSRMHGLYGGLDFEHRPTGEKE